MPSPFPGLDPFVEGQLWQDFHHTLITVMRESLWPRVLPRYVVRVEERVYVERPPEDPRVIIPDVTMLAHEGGEVPAADAVAPAPVITVAPVVLTLPMPERKRQAFLTVRERETTAVVTVIEVLSPDNKRAGSDGRREYLRKREAVLESDAHLVELDLLRGGARLPTVEPLPPAACYAFVSRENRRPRVEVYPWTLRQPLPTIPVPLAGDDPDVALDLQAIFTAVYDRAGYGYSLDYSRPIEPPLSAADAAWVRQILATVSLPSR
jgi:hypothetical protein